MPQVFAVLCLLRPVERPRSRRQQAFGTLDTLHHAKLAVCKLTPSRCVECAFKLGHVLGILRGGVEPLVDTGYHQRASDRNREPYRTADEPGRGRESSNIPTPPTAICAVPLICCRLARTVLPCRSS